MIFQVARASLRSQHVATKDSAKGDALADCDFQRRSDRSALGTNLDQESQGVHVANSRIGARGADAVSGFWRQGGLAIPAVVNK